MSWIAPVTNRTSTAHYAYTDLNRVGEDLQYLADLLNGYGYAVTVNSKIDWAVGETPRAEQMGQYITDIKSIRAALTLWSTTPAAPDDAIKLWWYEANAIEQILVDVETAINNMVAAWFYSGDLYAGEV
ncbi:MAG: hypothetical protein VB078_00475 [Clostridiaceae bacterium]|nr:hypothetical protein [Clostridiaceae bacterium]